MEALGANGSRRIQVMSQLALLNNDVANEGIVRYAEHIQDIRGDNAGESRHPRLSCDLWG